MGSILFAPGTLTDNLSEIAGYKSGMALSQNDLYDCLSGTSWPDKLKEAEVSCIRLRAEEYDALFYKLLYKIGYSEEEYDGDIIGAKYFHKYKNTHHEQWDGVTKIFIDLMPKMIADASKSGGKLLDPTPLIKTALNKYGKIGVQMARERIDAMDRYHKHSANSPCRFVEWDSQIKLSDLFNGDNGSPSNGKFIDQQFINYLSSNSNKLCDMHWRKFEQLTAEFFNRSGYQVQLGPGSNDDGVDVRVWNNQINDNPQFIIQCKRQKNKVDKVVIKGLFSDVQHEGADLGLLVTTSELSPGARETIKARGYPIQEINKNELNKWLKQLRIPGSGIVRV